MDRVVPKLFGPAMNRVDAGEAKRVDHMLKETDLLAGRLKERDGQPRPRDLQRQTGKSRAAADVDQLRRLTAGGLVDRRQHSPGVEKQPPLDQFRVGNRGQIEPLVPLKEQIAIGNYLGLLVWGEG